MADKNIYDTLIAEMSGVEPEDLSHYGEITKWWKSGIDTKSRKKNLEALLSDEKFQNELKTLDSFRNFDFSPYKSKEFAKGLDNAPMEDVLKWYDAAKKSIDPKGKLRGTELYDTKGDATFSLLERYDKYADEPSEDLTVDWFAQLAKDLGYSDTAEGYDQLEKDLNTVLTRKKIADHSNKYGTATKFVFGNTFDRMDQGHKPTLGDIVSDEASNAAWFVPSGEFLKGLQFAKAAPKLDKIKAAEGMLDKADDIAKFLPSEASKLVELAKKTGEPLSLRLLASAESNAVAPTINELARYALSSNDQSLLETLKGIVTETAVNIASPLKLATGLLGTPLGFINNGVIKNAAEKRGLNPVANELKDAFMKGYGWLDKNAPMFTAYIDNRLGNDAFAERLKKMSLRQLGSWFGIGKEDKNE